MENAQLLSLRPLSQSTKAQLQTYFNDGLGPSSIMNVLRDKAEMDPNFPLQNLADAAVYPKSRAVYYQHDQWRKHNLGGRGEDSCYEKLICKIPTYVEAGNSVLISQQPFAIAVMTPIMKRAHFLPSASNICFVDSTASCDSENHIITFFLTPTVCGGVPLGVVITSSTTEAAYTAGFQLLKSAFGKSAFGSSLHPSVFMTDDSDAERNAIKAVWPDSDQKLCLFHVPQALWRWLWDAKHHIAKNDRKELMLQFRQVMYATTEHEAAEKFDAALESAEDYPQYESHLQQLWERRELWCLAWRRTPAMRGHHTNNYAEVTVRLYKDHVLSRCKAYNAVALVDFTLTIMESYYRHRLLAFAHSRVRAPHLLLADLQRKAAYITDPAQIQSLGSHLYQVPSEKQDHTWYDVDTSVGICSCTAGMFGKCCKHQIAVQHFFSEALPNAPPVTTADRYCAAVLAIGDAAGAADFYSTDFNDIPLNTAGQPDDSVLHAVAASSGSSTEVTATVAEHQLPDDDEVSAACVEACSLLTQKIAAFSPKSQCVKSGLEVFTRRLAGVSNESQLASFLHSSGNAVPLRYRAGAVIRVQPTSLSRRRPGITRGSKRAPSGRPAAIPAKRKRQRALGTNIRSNVPNAKSHGAAH